MGSPSRSLSPPALLPDPPGLLSSLRVPQGMGCSSPITLPGMAGGALYTPPLPSPPSGRTQTGLVSRLRALMPREAEWLAQGRRASGDRTWATSSDCGAGPASSPHLGLGPVSRPPGRGEPGDGWTRRSQRKSECSPGWRGRPSLPFRAARPEEEAPFAKFHDQE